MFHVLHVSTGYSDGSIEKRLIEEAGGSYELIREPDEESILAAGQNADALLVALTVVSARVIRSLPKLQVIVRAGIGVDNIDLAAAKERGVHVCNLPRYCQEEVADHTVALLLSLERRLFPQVLDVRAGSWKPPKQYGAIRGMCGATVGFIGCGGIAQKVMPRLIPFGVELIGYDPYLPEDVAGRLGLTLVSLDDVLRRSDFLLLHVPLTAETKHILNAEAFSKMKPQAYIINTARGPLIDTDALYDAVSSGRIGGAALDVIEGDLEAAKRFAAFGNVLITPHTAYYSAASGYRICAQAGELLADYIRGNGLRNVIV